MSHRCGANCRRKRGLRSECEPCNRYKESRRKTVVAGGKRRRLTQHMLDHLRGSKRKEITRERVAYVLDNWVVRGVYTNPQGLSRVHYAFVPDLGNVVRVAVSLDGTKIITAFKHSQARAKLLEGDFAYFANQLKLSDMEVRNEPDLPV